MLSNLYINEFLKSPFPLKKYKKHKNFDLNLRVHIVYI